MKHVTFILSSVLLFGCNNVYEGIETRSKVPAPIGVGAKTVRVLPKTVQGFYLTSDAGFQLHPTVDDTIFLGKEYVRIEIEGEKVFYSEVIAAKVDDFNKVFKNYSIVLTNNHLTIFNTTLNEELHRISGKVDSKLKKRKEKLIKYFSENSIASVLPIRRVDDFVILDSKLKYFFDLSAQKVYYFSSGGKCSVDVTYHIQLKKYQDYYCLNIDFGKVTGGWTNIIIHPDPELRRFSLSYINDGYIKRNIELFEQNIGLEIMPTSSTEEHFDFLYDPSEASIDYLVHLDSAMHHEVYEKEMKPDDTEIFALRKVFNPKYWYVYSIAGLALLIIGLLSFFPLKYL